MVSFASETAALGLPGLIAAAGILWLFGVTLARGQVSPGELSAAHADLDGLLNCVKCHNVKSGDMDSQCLSCHEGVAWTIEQNRGFHVRLPEGKRCSDCHPEHAGRDLELIFWEEGAPEKFDHTRAGWPLEGAHTKVKCRECHKPEFQASHAYHLLKRKDPRESWIGLEPECFVCHKDPHKGRFGTSCTDCHGNQDWKKIDKNRFDHNRTRYPLRGKHATLECAQCHDPVKAWGKKPRFANCTDCHRDPHAGTATLAGRTVDCAACHSVRGFKPSTYTVKQHLQSRFPLEGKHAKVDCAKCHVKNPPGVPRETLGRAGVLLRPASDACTSCHEDAHGGQLAARADKGRCDACHSPEHWKPSRYTIADHRKTKFPLEGKHAKVECAACHGPQRKGLPALPGPDVLGKARVAFRVGKKGCTECHVDPHRGRYAPGGKRAELGDCQRCHGFDRFRPSNVDFARHADFGFKLEGAHRAAPCFVCHEPVKVRRTARTTLRLGARVADLLLENTKKSCKECHESPHGSQFDVRKDGGRCDACHGADAFKPASRFDHDVDTQYPLIGAHARVECQKCHPAQRGPNGKPMTLYRPISTACSHCHGTKALAPLGKERSRRRR